MPPKVKVTGEQITETAVQIVRKCGEQALNARAVAEQLGVSTQPIFSNFSTMAMLRSAVITRAEQLYESYQAAEIAGGRFPPYKAAGMAYIRFSQEERELFKLLYMRDRTEESRSDEALEPIIRLIEKNTGLNTTDAKLFHLEMWACVHGIATMTATSFLVLEEDLISRILSDVYQGLKQRYGKGDQHESND